MKPTGPVGLVLVLLTITWVSSMPAKESTTRRPSQPQIGDTIKQLTSQLMNVNTTSTDITLDTRTPPKVKQQMKKPPRTEATLENSHPGVAVPVEESDVVLEESTKTFNFYKIENKPTTDRGLSTWVLLNSHTVPPPSSTTKTSRKPPIKLKLEENKNSTTTDAEIFNKITKPLFKKRPLPTTTRKPTTMSVKTSTVAEKEYKLTKIKASELTNAINNKTKTEIKSQNKKSNATSADSKKESSLEPESMQEIATIKPNNKVSTTISINDNELIPLEAKDDEIELITTTASSKKTRRPSTKRKKTKKQKRPRPSIDKADTNITQLVNKVKDKPISTQIYNYLSREIIPTVGVGLVGLMVTAGLASYFLYPFGAARRSYEVDRKDKEGSYYYSDEHAPGGVAEEEIIGKVIAGMPSNSNYPNYRSPSSRDAYSNLRYKENDFGFRKAQPQSSVDAIYLTPSKQYGDEEDMYVPRRNHKTEFYNPQRNYNKEIFEHNQETGYTVEDKQFVVGNVPKEVQEVTPAVVPEHGPRNLPETTTKESPQGLSEIVADYAPRTLPEIFEKRDSSILTVRKRRSTDFENEILTDENVTDQKIHKISNKEVDYTASTQATSVAEVTTAETGSTTTISTNTSHSLIYSIRMYLETKIKIALELLQSTTRAISRYFAEVQRRFNSKTSDTLGKEQPRNH